MIGGARVSIAAVVWNRLATANYITYLNARLNNRVKTATFRIDFLRNESRRKNPRVRDSIIVLLIKII